MRGVWVVVLVGVLGCSEADPPHDPRAGTEDAAAGGAGGGAGAGGDGGAVGDAARADARVADATREDAGPRDAAASDAAQGDGGPVEDAGRPVDATAADAGEPAACLGADLAGGLTAWADGPHRATVEVEGDACDRRFRLRTTQPLRDGQPENPESLRKTRRACARRAPSLTPCMPSRSPKPTRTPSTPSATAPSRTGSRCPACPAAASRRGGFGTTSGRGTPPTRRPSASPRSIPAGPELPGLQALGALSGRPLQIMQDTGTGGSHPISTDRVIWALGARSLLAQLTGERRGAFAGRALEALRATTAHDRAVAFDAAEGLYRGEQSFLDWRGRATPPGRPAMWRTSACRDRCPPTSPT
ncbi:MAG: hypothetical protein R3F60_10980 [bacterium]